MARWQGNTTSRELTKKIKKKTNDFLKITTWRSVHVKFSICIIIWKPKLH